MWQSSDRAELLPRPGGPARKFVHIDPEDRGQCSWGEAGPQLGIE